MAKDVDIVGLEVAAGARNEQRVTCGLGAERRVTQVYLDGDLLEGVFAEAVQGSLRFGEIEGSAVAVPSRKGGRDAFLRNWVEKAKASRAAKRAGGASILLLTLAACGGGGGDAVEVDPETASLLGSNQTVSISSAANGAVISVPNLPGAGTLSGVTINASGSGALVLDFADSSDTVVVSAGTISGFSTIVVVRGTVDFSAISLPSSVKVIEVGSGAILTYTQFNALDSVDLRTGATSGDLEVLVNSLAQAQAVAASNKVEAGVAVEISVASGDAGELTVAEVIALRALTADDGWNYSIVSDDGSDLFDYDQNGVPSLKAGVAAILAGADSVSIADSIYQSEMDLLVAAAGADDVEANVIEYGLSASTNPLGVVSVSVASEGQTLYFTLSTSPIEAGKSLSYILTGTGITAADVSGASLAGSVVVDATGIAVIALNLAADAVTEGTEALTLTVSTPNGPLSASVNIADTSTTPVLVPTYSVAPSVSSVNEGATVTYTISTSNVADGTVLSYTLSGIQAADLTTGSLSGNVVVNGGTATIAVALAADNLTEAAPELINLSLSRNGSVVATSSPVTVVDSSQTPVATYSVASSVSGVNEGATVTYTISTSNVADGTVLSYALSGIQAADLATGSLSGNVIVNGGTATIAVTLAADNLTEGAQTIALALSRSGSVVANAPSVTLNDTSVGSFTVTAADIIAANTAGQTLAVVTSASADPTVNVTILSDEVTATNGFIIQGNGNHNITSGGLADVITIDGSGNNTISSGAGNDTITAGSGNDTLSGGQGNDTIAGGNGNDTITGGAGADVMTGGQGNDTFIVGDGEFAAGESINGGDGTDTLVASGTNNFAGGTLTSIEVIDLNSDATFTVGQLAGVTTITGDGTSIVRIVAGGGAAINLGGIAITDVALLQVGAGTTITLSAGNLAEISAIQNAGTIIVNAAGYADAIAKGATNANVQVVDTLANIEANLPALANAVSVSAGAISVAEAAELVEGGFANSISYTLSDAPANLGLAATAVLQNADGMTATIAANAVEAAAVEAAAGVMRTAPGNTSATFSYSVSDTAANLASLPAGLNSAASVTATSVATVAQANAIQSAAAAAADAGAQVGAGTTLSYSVQGTAAELATTLTAAARNAATDLTATTTANIAQANTLAAATNGGATTYSVSATFAEATLAGNAAGVNGAQLLTVTDSVNALQAAQVNSLGAASKSYPLADTVQVLLTVDAATTANASAAIPSGAPYTLANVGDLVSKFGGAKIANGSLTVVDSAANWGAVTAAQAAEINGAASTITGGVLNAAQASNVHGAFGGAGFPAYAIADSASAIAGLTAAVRNGATVLTANTPATMDEAVVLDAATPAASYSITDSASNIAGSGAGNAAAARNGATNIVATGQATVAQATVIDGATNSGTTSYSITDTASNIFNAIAGGANNDVVDRATDVTATGNASVAQLTAIDAATNSGVTSIAAVDVIDTVAALDLGNAALLALLNQVDTVTVRDGFAVLNAAPADAIRAYADVVVVEMTQAQLSAMAATADVFKQEVDQIVITTDLTVADAANLQASTAFGATATYNVSDTAFNLVAGGNAALVNGAQNLTSTTAATVTQASSLIALNNGGTLTYSISDTAANIADAPSSVISGATGALGLSGVGTVSPAQAATLSGYNIAAGTYDVAGTAAALSSVNGAALTDANVGTVTVTDGGHVSQSVAALVKIFGAAAYSAANFSIVDSAVNVAAANDLLQGYAQNVTLTGNSSVAEVLAVRAVLPMGQFLSYNLADSASNIVGASSAIRDGATNIVVTGGANATQAAAIEAASNSGTATIDAVTDSAAALSGLSNAVLNLVTGAVTASTAATGAQASTIAGFTKAVVYSVSDTAANVAASTGLNEAVNVTATGIATAAEAVTIEAATNSGTTSIAALNDSATAIAGLNNAVLNLVTGAVNATTAATAAEAATIAGFTKAVTFDIFDTIGNILAQSNVTLLAADDITVDGTVTVAQAIALNAVDGAGVVNYAISDTYQNIILNTDVAGDVDSEVAPSALDGATSVTINHPITIAQATQIDGLSTPAIVYSIVDSDQNIAAAINANSVYITGATSVATTGGIVLMIEDVPGMGLAIVTTKAGKDALPVNLDAADYLIEASVADMTGADAAWYAARAATNVRVVDTFANLTSGIPIVEATYAVGVTDAITVAQHAVVAAFAPSNDNTVYSLADTAANLGAGGSVVARNWATNITATGTATAAEATAILAASNSGSTSIAAVAATFAEASGFALDPLDFIGSLTVTDAVSAANAAALRDAVSDGNLGQVNYSLSDTTANIAGASSGVYNGATNITGTGVATAAQAQTLFSASNSGTTSVAIVTDTAANVASLSLGSNDSVATINTSGTASVAQATAIVALDALAGTTVNYGHSISGGAASILTGSVAVLDTSVGAIQVVGAVDVATATSLLALDTDATTIAFTMSISDTAANLIGASAAVKALGNGVQSVTIDGATTVANVTSVSTQYLQAGVDIGGQLFFSLSDSFANLSAIGAASARTNAGSITVTDASLTVAQANVAENWNAAVVYDVADTATAIAGAMAGGVMNDELLNAASITITTAATVAEAAEISETSLSYNIADSAANVYAAYNTVNTTLGSDRGTIQEAGTVTLTTGATLAQYRGSATERGLDEVVNLVGYSISDSVANLITAITADAAALSGATQVTLNADTALTVVQATQLMGLGNFNGFGGAFRIIDTVDNVLTGDQTVVGAASSYTLLDTYANLVTNGGIDAVKLALGISDVNVQVIGTTVTQAQLTEIDARNGNGTVTYSLSGTIAEVAGNSATLLNQAINLSAGLGAPEAATIADVLKILDATNTGTTDVSVSTLNASGATTAQLAALATYEATLGGANSADAVDGLTISQISNLSVSGALSVSQVGTLLALASPGSAQVNISAMDSTYLATLTTNAANIANLGITGVLGDSNLTVTAAQFEALGAKFADGLTVTIDATGATEAQIVAMSANITNIVGSGILNLSITADGAFNPDLITDTVFDDVLGQSTSATVNAADASTAEVGSILANLTRIADNGLTQLTLDLADFDLLTAGAKSLLNDKVNVTGGLTIQGTPNADEINASLFTKEVTINGLDSADTITGGSGADFINGGGGDDSIEGGGGSDTITGGLGNDTLTGGADNDRFMVDSGSDIITDLVTGDSFEVSVGATVTANNVSAFVATAATMNAGTATINSAAGGSSISLADATSDAGAVYQGYNLVGGAGVDTLTGSAENDVITGNGGADFLNGGGGNDTINGALDGDSLNGGVGDDTYNIAAGAGIVTITDTSGNDQVNIGGLNLGASTIALSDGGDTIVATNGANIAGVNVGGATTAENLTLTGGITMTLAQHNAITITAAGVADSVTLTTAGTATGQATVETYNLANAAGNDFTLGAGGQNVTGQNVQNEIVRTGLQATVSGSISLGLGDTDQLVVTTTGTNISGATLTGVEQINLDSNVNATMTIAQNGLVNTALGTNTITLSNSGITTGAAQVETYNLANAAGNFFTLGAGAQNVTGAGAQDDVVRTGARTTVLGSINLGDGAADQLVITTTATNISGATLTGVEQINLDNNVNATMTVAQNGLVNTAAGTNTITLSNAGAATAATQVEIYDIRQAVNQVTIGGNTAVDIIADDTTDDADTIVVGGNSVSGRFTTDASDIISVSAGANITGARGNNNVVGEAFGATNLDLNNLTGNVTMTQAQHEGLSNLTNTNNAQTFVISSGGAVTARNDVEAYVLSPGGSNNITVNTDQAEVNITGLAGFATTVTVGGLTVTGTYALANGADVIVATDGANIAGVNGGIATTAENLTLTGGITMTRLQHEALAITAAGGADSVTITTAGAVTAAAAIETYNVSSGGSNNVTVNAGNTAVAINGDAANATTVTIGGQTVTGTYALAHTADVIVATNGANIAGVNGGTATTAENLTLTGGITMTRLQHEALAITAAGGADSVTITTAGAVTAAAAVETYNVSSGGSNNVTVNAGNTAVAINGDAANATTVTIGGQTVTGTYALAHTADVIVATNGANIVGVNGGAATTAENLTLSGGITMTQVQHQALVITDGDGASSAETVTITTGGAVTAAAAVETYNVSRAGGGANNVTVNAGNTAVNINGTNNFATTVTIGGQTVTGTYVLDHGADIIVATDGANIAGVNGGAVTTAENLTLTGGITMTLAQHEALAITAAGGSDSVTLTTSGTFTGEAAVETYNLADAAGNVFTQVLGNTSVVGGSGADRIKTDGADATRGALTIDLSEGGQDTVMFFNTVLGHTSNGINDVLTGLGGRIVHDASGGDGDVNTGERNATTLNDTIADWTAQGSNDGVSYVTVNGFTAGNSGDRVAYLDGSTQVLIGGFSNNVSLTTNNLSGLAVNSVIEISSEFQINDGTNLGAVATMLDQLNNVQDGDYYIVIYDGNDANSNAWIYAATATEGDGFDFADTNGVTNGFDTDTVELIGVLMGVGADTLTSQNFISSVGL